MILRRILIGGMAALLAVLLALSPPAAKAGTPLNTSFIIDDQAIPLEHPAVAYSGLHEEHLVVWCASGVGGSMIYGRKVPKNGPMGPVFPISGADPSHKHCYPDVAYNTRQDRYLIVWEFNDGSYDNVQGRLLYANGTLSGDLLFGSGPALRNRTKPRVDYGYTSDLYMVVWEAITSGTISSDIEGQVVNADGTKFNVDNFTVAQGTNTVSHDQPDLAYNISRNEYLVAWRRHDSNGNNYDIFGQRVTRDAVLLGGQLGIGYFSPPESAPSVAALQSPAPQSGIYLVAWQLQYSSTDNDIYARLVGGDGILGAMVEMTGTASSLNETHPAVAADQVKRRFLGLWTSTYSTQWTFSGLRGRDITSDGQSGAIHWINGIFSDHAAAAPGVGGDFLVVYDEFKLGVNMDIYGRRWGNRLYVPLIRR